MKKRFLFLLLLPSFLTAQAAFPQNVSTSLSRSESYVGETVYLSFSLQTEEKPVAKKATAKKTATKKVTAKKTAKK